MIAVDTSALMAIVLKEPAADALIDVLSSAADVVISAGTVAEVLIVAARRNVAEEMARLIEDLGFEVAPVTLSTARGVADAYGRWGKGVHPAALNFGDCFAYEIAKSLGCPLLFVGNDFARTDLEAASPVGR